MKLQGRVERLPTTASCIIKTPQEREKLLTGRRKERKAGWEDG